MQAAEEALDEAEAKGKTGRHQLIPLTKARDAAEKFFDPLYDPLHALKTHVDKLRKAMKEGNISFVECFSKGKMAEPVRDPVNERRLICIFDTKIDGRMIKITSEPALLHFFGQVIEGITVYREGRAGRYQKLYSSHVAPQDRQILTSWENALRGIRNEEDSNLREIDMSVRIGA